jgi:AcrR family transcriptional regulator
VSQSPPRADQRPPKPPRIDVAAIRREQIVEAAAGVIAEQGIQNLSLSEIESRTGMSRGQLTYYFKAKEDILLAVFDRMVRRMRERVQSADHPCHAAGPDADAWQMTRGLLTTVLSQPVPADFTQLQFTFLAQTGHRDDFRQRLASLYEDWRAHMAGGMADLTPPVGADPRLLASLVQAVVHGLVMQLVADPAAFDRTRMLDLCVAVLGGALNRTADGPAANPSGEG